MNEAMQRSAGNSGHNGAFFEKIDLRLGHYIVDTFVRDECPEIVTAAALASRLSRSGHSCIPFQRGKLEAMLSSQELPPSVDLAGVDEWGRLLLDQSAAITCDDALQGTGLGNRLRPLVVDEQRGLLYLYRYWAHERRILDCIRELRQVDGRLVAAAGSPRLRQFIEGLFPGDALWQRAAAATAALRRFAVITGGPGTGKTTTAAKVLALLALLKPDISIAVAAPTGKAAARIGEAMEKGKKELDERGILGQLAPETGSDAILNRIPSTAATLHRLLGPIRESPSFRHNRENPLPLDVLVVDEASMVDLPLMARTMDALRQGSRLILLGDKNQLASVEIGVVFGDICSKDNVDCFSTQSAAAVREAAGVEVPAAASEGWIEGSIVELKKNFRFGSDSAIATLSKAVNGGDAVEVIALLEAARRETGSGTAGTGNTLQTGNDDVAVVWEDDTPERRENLKKKLEPLMVERYGGLFGGTDTGGCFCCLDRFRVLSPLRRGPYGAVSLNRLIEEILTGRGLIPAGARYYQGKPVIVLENDYGVHLYNGDVGVINPGARGELRAWFPGDRQEPYRGFLPGRLPEHETVYAMTVHKSQGSEFDEILLLLPPGGSPVLTRELLYTAITRARKRVIIWGSRQVISQCVESKVERVSGMGER